MKETTVEYAGVNNFKKLTFEVDTTTKQHTFTTEYLDVDIDVNRTISQIFADQLSVRDTNTVEVLYSGGIDSEIVLITCLEHNIPCRAITLRMLVKGIVVNTHDLYYAGKFCRQRNIEQKIIDLDLNKFVDSGLFLDYAEPFLNKEFHVTTHMWLMEQCSGFVVMGGIYPWPWHNGPKVISPSRASFNFYNRFMRNKNISGISDMQCHSLDAAVLIIKSHLKNAANYGDITVPYFKQKIFADLGFDVEPRLRSYGWEDNVRAVFNKDDVNRLMIDRFGVWSTERVIWGQTIADAIGGQPGTWDRFK
jgi:hypothetical protein